jgi:hypothetical protein
MMRTTEVIPKSAEVAQPGRALDSVALASEGEAEDRVVAGSNPALGTTMVFWHKPRALSFSLPEELEVIHVTNVFKSILQ